MMQYDLSDQDLCIQLRQSSAVAFESIYKRYWRPLYGFVFRQLGIKEDAQEVVHDLFLSLWQNREQVQIQKLDVYLFISARNLTNKFVRSRINLRKYLEYQLLHEVFESTQENINSSDDLARAIEQVVKQMPEKTAQIFKMSKMDEMSVKKIASKMNLTEKAVEYHITKSLKMLREHLQDFHTNN